MDRFPRRQRSLCLAAGLLATFLSLANVILSGLPSCASVLLAGRLQATPLRAAIGARGTRLALAAEDVRKCTVAQLKERLQEFGLPTSGRKKDLVERLEAELLGEDAEPADTEEHVAAPKPSSPPAPEGEEDAEAAPRPPLVYPPPFDISTLGPLAKKEQRVLRWVQTNAPEGDLDAILGAIERFANEASWLKVAGGGKARLLTGAMRPGDRVVEMGTFVGYSSMLMGRRLRQLGGAGYVTSCEVDAATAMVAREIHKYAGVCQEVRVRVGRGGDWIATGQLGKIDLLIMDHRGTKYHEDLLATESSLAASGARVLADNVLYPGAPLFLNVLQGRYDTSIHDVKEFLYDDIDDWIVICEPPPLPPANDADEEPEPEEQNGWGPRQIARRPGMTQPEPAPPELRQWSAEVDAICWRSLKEDVDWRAFQAHMAPKLRAWRESKRLGM